MLNDIAQHLVNQIKTVSALAESTGLEIGGTESDPTMTSIPAPAAWVVFESAQDASTADGKAGADSQFQRLLLSYRVVLVLPYGDGETALKEQMKLISDVATAVRGTSPNDILGYGADPWAFQGTSLLSIETDKIAYSLIFTTRAYFKHS